MEEAKGMFSFRLFFLICLLIAIVATKKDIKLDVSAQGQFGIKVDGREWIRGNTVGFRTDGQWKTNVDGQLKSTLSNYEGEDGWGKFNATKIAWKTENRQFDTIFRVYSAHSVVTFEQSWPRGAPDTTTHNKDSVISAFPSFVMGSGEEEKAFMGYSGPFLGEGIYGSWSNQTKKIPGGTHGGGPFLLYNKDLSTVSILSSASQFMVGSFTNDVFNNELSVGLLGSITSVPAQFSYTSILYFGSDGINDAMEEWGRLMLEKYDKKKDGPHYDFTNNYLGYNTDHGAYYYYFTEPGKNYQQTLLDVKDYSVSAKIPYKWILLDSWWYWKGVNDGVKNWTCMPDIMPDGFEYFQQKTGWKFIAHNRYWSSDNVYAKQNGGKFNFIVEPPFAIPVDYSFWEYLISTSVEWGLTVYEQDWLYNEFMGLNATLNSVSLARQWLLEMGHACQANRVNIQYCMPYPRHALQSIEIPAVTQIRASDDHVPGLQTWKLGTSSLFAHSIGLAPFKDVFWSTSVQPGNPYKLTEPYPALEAVVATLTAGPVTPGDKVGMTTVSLVMKSCMTDGTLLKASRPATSIDATFVERGFGSGGPKGEVWTTHTKVGEKKFHHVFAAELKDGYVIDSTHLRAHGENVYFFADGKIPTIFNLKSQPIKLTVNGQQDFHLVHTSPIFHNGWVLLGELEKWIPVSVPRFQQISEDDENVSVNLLGAVGETAVITVGIPSANGFRLAEIHCSFPNSGKLILSLPALTCEEPRLK